MIKTLQSSKPALVFESLVPTDAQRNFYFRAEKLERRNITPL